jgi:hypothetical protein
VASEPPANAPPPGRPWGFWATIGLSAVVMAAQFVVSAAVAVFYIACTFITTSEAAAHAAVKHLASNGLYLSLAMLASAPVCSVLVFTFAWLRRRQHPLREYLGLQMPTVGALALGLAAMVVMLGLAEGLDKVLEEPSGSKFMLETYRTAGFLPILVLAFALAAPLFEELLFRGFLLEGIRRSAGGPVAAVLVSSVLWALLHLQYAWTGISFIFVLGIVLAVARLMTGSLYLCFAMHTAYNLACLIETAFTAGPPV